MIVITVAIGTLVYSFASTAFGGFGAGFSNLVQNAGSQLTENVVVEQVYFLHNDTGIADSCGIPLECAGDIFIGNSGSNTATINDVFVTNVNSGAPFGGANIEFLAFDTVGGHYDILLPDVGGGNPQSLCSGTCILSIPPGQTVMLRFETNGPVSAGTTYAFTLITARGNQIVAYEKA